MQTAMNLNAIAPGFANPSLGTQRVFRQILEAMSHPGRIVPVDEGLPMEGLDVATAAVALTLLDFETSLWTDLGKGSSALQWLAFHCGAPLTQVPSSANFAIITRPSEMPPLSAFGYGTEREPHTAATLILQVEYLEERAGKRLTGPGIEGGQLLRVEGVSQQFWADRKAASDLFPMGVDVILTCNDGIAALPRSTNWDELACM